MLACLLATASSSIVPSAAAVVFVSVPLRSMGSLTQAGFVPVVQSISTFNYCSPRFESCWPVSLPHPADRIKQQVLVRGDSITHELRLAQLATVYFLGPEPLTAANLRVLSRLNQVDRVCVVVGSLSLETASGLRLAKIILIEASSDIRGERRKGEI